MREILFRGKSESNCEWVYGNPIYDNVSGKHYIVPFGNITESDKVGQEGCTYCVGFEVIPETVGQYTGLTDKNGKKIFEGDILKDHSFTIDDFSKVVYDTENAQFSLADCDEICDTMEEWERYREDYEIVGNVYDNPELLESED